MLTGPISAIGIIGATVMPHSIFLGSALSTQDRISSAPDKLARIESTLTVETNMTTSSSSSANPLFGLRRMLLAHMLGIKERIVSVFRMDSLAGKVEARTHAEHENNSYAFVRAHVYHGMIDIAISLLGIAVVVNSMCVLFLPVHLVS